MRQSEPHCHYPPCAREHSARTSEDLPLPSAPDARKRVRLSSRSSFALAVTPEKEVRFAGSKAQAGEGIGRVIISCIVCSFAQLNAGKEGIQAPREGSSFL